MIRRANWCIFPVGGNAVSAFLSWRLQATNACDVTLVWKSGYETVAQYGISIKSQLLGNERFKPYAVVRTPEEAAQTSKIPYDYVVLCVKALPDVYDLASIIESVVTPQHTCILLNTTSSIGIEEYLEERYPTNVVLSLVCGADLSQVGAAEFEHKGQSTDMWVGWANKNNNIPEAIQKDMAEALAMTLSTAQVSCLVSLNIRQQQLEKMIGPIAFHPTSVLFNNPNLSQLYEMPGVSAMVNGIIDELLNLAKSYGCELDDGFREKTIANMRASQDAVTSVMYQDFLARRPMEVETFLGSPIRLAKEAGISLPRVEVLYALLHDRNQRNLKGELPPSPTYQGGAPPRSSSMSTAGARPPMNGMKAVRGSRAPSMVGQRRGPPPNGYPPRMNGMNGHPQNGGPYSRRDSVEGDLEEFSHVMLYENVPDGQFQDGSSGSFGEPSAGTPSSGELALRERELQLRHREMELREREAGMQMRRGPPPRGPPPRQRPPPGGAMYDDEDEDDFFDAMGGGPPNNDNFDMLSITSRRHRKMPSGGGGMYNQPNASRSSKNIFSRKNRSSTRLMQDIPSPHDSLRNNPLLGYSSNRYGTVDRTTLEAESRAGSMTNGRMNDLAMQQGPYPGMPGPSMRRASHSPGNPLSPNGMGHSPPNGYSNGTPRNGPMPGQRPSPPGGVRQPIPRHPPGHGNAVAPQQVEQHAGVSTLYPPKPTVRNLTGSVGASAKTGKSALTESSTETSANSSASSLQNRPRQQIIPA
ncbi:hypothetical protein BT63DRAFT_416813 [Microthyrium microscopicum]|uniref:ApbA-domain-containing protein n=1 Tax=Microthyrium microscopicum TaxID=703497 RepID=A0A6A6U2C9_9PEZI|nr:hypothetical protein BT63DRAFT_416813 [Microthyrium microscopicum]